MALKSFVSPRIEPVLTFEGSLYEKLALPSTTCELHSAWTLSFTLGFTFQMRKSRAAGPWSFCARKPEFGLGFHCGTLHCATLVSLL